MSAPQSSHDSARAHESFLRHRRYRDLKLAVLLCIVSLLVYVWHDPIGGPNGGTWLGYTLGTVGALIILLLTALGVRKRRYRSTLGTVKGWVSVHVYFGLALVVIVTLHTGFQFGMNIHTLAYILMLLVIVTGTYGITAYARYPTVITDNRSEATREAWLAEIMDLNEQAVKLADGVNPEVHNVVVRSTERIRIGGNWWQQVFGLTGPEHKEPVDELQQKLKPREQKGPAFTPSATMGEGTVMFMAGKLVDASEKQAERIQQLLNLITRRNNLISRLNRDIEAHARMQIWLYLHVPLTCALLAALAAHIISVFLYG